MILVDLTVTLKDGDTNRIVVLEYAEHVKDLAAAIDRARDVAVARARETEAE